jgi:molybdopterin-guanine dinucleotide biosynthesis protein A
MVAYSVVIQAGGESSRMGQDKGLLPFMSVTLVEYILLQVKEMGDEHIIISNTPEKYQQFGLPIYSDVYPGLGALSGLYSAISHATQKVVLVLACDMPFVNKELLGHMVDKALEHEVVVPRLQNGFIEPFRGVYHKACLPAIQQALDIGKRKVISFFDDVNVYCVEWEEVIQYDPEGLSFVNINTPADLKRAVEIAQDLER